MQIQVLKSKIHRVKKTGADLNYIGSITIDENLLEASNIIEGEKSFHCKHQQWRTL
jgi:aspartate 1-decarboxylase